MEDVKDRLLKQRLDKLEERLNRIESIRLIPQTTTLKQLIDIVNKITDNMKRNR